MRTTYIQNRGNILCICMHICNKIIAFNTVYGHETGTAYAFTYFQDDTL